MKNIYNILYVLLVDSIRCTDFERKIYIVTILKLLHVHILCPVLYKPTFLQQKYILGVPKFTVNLYCICLSEHETCAYADTVQICGIIWNAQYVSRTGGMVLISDVHSEKVLTCGVTMGLRPI